MKKLNKIFCSAAIVCGVFSTMTMSVSAAGNEVRVPEVTTTVVTRDKTSLTEEVTSDIIPSVTEETTYLTSEETTEPTVFETEETEESSETEDGVILPNGNATLGEDVNNGVLTASSSRTATQSILIIDKNARGEDNVYFLNMVDKYDLMAFADDIPENVQAAMDEANGKVEVPTDENGEPVEDTTKTEQMGAEFLRLYPAANILAATKKDFEPKNRKELFAKIATGEWDAVIVVHSQFDRMGLSKDRLQKYMREEMESLRYELDAAIDADGKESFTVKEIERIIARHGKKLSDEQDRMVKDEYIDFEEMGFDKLFVD